MTPADPRISLREPGLFGGCAITDAVNMLATAGIEQRGAIFTKREVVDFILDLSGYTTDQPLYKLRFLEPSFGGGDFILPAIDRLLETWSAAGRPEPYRALSDAIRGVELHRATFIKTRTSVVHRLSRAGMTREEAEGLADEWLTFADYLLLDTSMEYDVIVGNPPYIRQEMIADVLMDEYRARYTTIYDRADIYIPFLERSLKSLKKGGHLGFICADRWMKNRYGGPLRQLVSDHYHLKIYVDMVDTPAFHSEVSAYPAITVISREKAKVTRIAYRPQIERQALADLARALTADERPKAASGVKELKDLTAGSEPWILDQSSQTSLLRRLESAFPLIEDAGCRVGIGVATGADKAFIGPYDTLDVERSRKLPLAMTRDIDSGTVKWRGNGIVNPFGDDGRLVDLERFPKLKAYLEARREQIAGRHVAQKAPANWYRTIDRIYPELARQPKLLIPDIKGDAHIVYEHQGLYPHHNLYFVTSQDWDLQALQAVLMSGIARLFVAAYSTKMRGGYLRFQAQYLRRIRIPRWSQVPADIRQRLKIAAESHDRIACNRAVFQLYGLSEKEQKTLYESRFQ
jgi:hypothetical protein